MVQHKDLIHQNTFIYFYWTLIPYFPVVRLGCETCNWVINWRLNSNWKTKHIKDSRRLVSFIIKFSSTYTSLFHYLFIFFITKILKKYILFLLFYFLAFLTFISTNIICFCFYLHVDMTAQSIPQLIALWVHLGH